MASFLQPEGRVRVYLCPGLKSRHRFSGPDGLAEFQRSSSFRCLPFGDALANATPAGPLATYPGDDSWTPEPYVPGVVLVGDALYGVHCGTEVSTARPGLDARGSINSA